MILAKQIPIHAQDFIRRCATDCRLGRYARDGDYRFLLREATKKSHKGLLEYLQRHDAKEGEAKYWAEVDHIIPQAVWTLLMPPEVRGPDRPDGCFMHVLSNLFWRGPNENRSFDQSLISVTQDEGRIYARKPPRERQEWAGSRIEIFLRTKHDEALVFPGDHIDPSRFRNMEARGTGTNWMGGYQNMRRQD
jgi:hypothetical protein